jgi:hypothetical protein
MVAVVLPGLIAFSGCPPNAGTMDEMPGNDGDSIVRTGAWMFAFYFAAPNNLVPSLISTAGIQLDADGSTRDYYFDGLSMGKSTWSQVDDNFELILESGEFAMTGKVVSANYIEGYVLDINTGLERFFAAHFLTPDPSQLPDPDQLKDHVVGLSDGSWRMTYFDHVFDEEFITVANSGGTNLHGIEVGIDSDGLIYALGEDGDNGPNNGSWYQYGKGFRISEYLGAAGESSWHGQFIRSNFIVGTFMHANGRASTFILRWRRGVDPIIGPGPIGPVAED